MFAQEGPCDCVSGDPAQLEFQSCIAAARRGDREALGRVMLSFRDYLFLVANEKLKPAFYAKGGASDFVQDTFVRAHLGFESFRGETVPEWRGWLRTILVRLLSNQRRRFMSTHKRQIHRELSADQELRFTPTDSGETPSRDLMRRERQEELVQALARLPDRYREVIFEHNQEKLPFDEIGRRRGISDEAARKRWSRAIGLLRKELGPAHESR